MHSNVLYTSLLLLSCPIYPKFTTTITLLKVLDGIIFLFFSVFPAIIKRWSILFWVKYWTDCFQAYLRFIFVRPNKIANVAATAFYLKKCLWVIFVRGRISKLMFVFCNIVVCFRDIMYNEIGWYLFLLGWTFFMFDTK